MSRLAALLVLTALPLHAQDGAQLFTLYCAACHGTDGKGATGGQLPSLAGSPWVTGDAACAIKIILHGLHGEQEVDGQLVNLEMPPQGGVIDDGQIAAILTYIRASWGNEAPPVSAELVKSTRSGTTDRTTPWTAGELLKLHSLSPSAPAIADLLTLDYSTDHLAPELIWTGAFMDTIRHWQNRGQDDLQPVIDRAATLTDAPALPAGARFRGCHLDPAGNATFLVQIGKQMLHDTWSPASPDDASSLVRTLELKEGGPAVEIPLSGRLYPRSESEWNLGDSLSITVEGASIETRCGSFALVLLPNQAATLTYRWK